MVILQGINFDFLSKLISYLKFIVNIHEVISDK